MVAYPSPPYYRKKVIGLIFKKIRKAGFVKRILFLIIPVSLLGFCFCPTPVHAEMKSYNRADAGADFPETDARTGRGYDNDRALGNPGGFDYKLGPIVLGIGGKTLPSDRSLKFENEKPNRAVVFGMEFRF
jgi:hypothetical protein